MRRGLRPGDLGDLLERPECATLAVHLEDGGLLLRPVWFEWRDGAFLFTTDRLDRKLRALERDPRCSILVAEDEWPYRSLEVRGVATWTTDGYREAAGRILRRYHPTADPVAYADAFDSPASPGYVVRLAPGVLTAFDFADERPAGGGSSRSDSSPGSPAR